MTGHKPVSILSPFRYPGGKTWLIPYIRTWLKSFDSRPQKLIEAFAGGSVVGLTAVAEDLVDSVTLIELDEDIADVWQTILSPLGDDFAEKVGALQLSPERVRQILSGSAESMEQRAMATLVRNRVAYGGIMAPGSAQLQRGENGKGLLSRWYPETLKKRIQKIFDLRERIHFFHGDGLDFLKRNANQRDAVYFLDPPYTVAGRRLYRHYGIEPTILFQATDLLAGDFLITYDDSDQISRLVNQYGLEYQKVLMKNRQHHHQKELLIGRNLRWIREDNSFELGKDGADRVEQGG